MGAASFRYRAFISYSHRDAALTQKLHRRLENYRVPRALRGTRDGTVIGARLGAMFRDRDELASSGSLSRGIEEALAASAALIVVCSPAAVASPWVDAEIAHFRRQHPDRAVFAFVVDGDPGIDPRKEPARAAFPLNLLRDDVDDPGSAFGEPIAADARETGDGFGAAFLKLVAGLLGVRYDQLRRRELRRRQQRWAAVAVVSLCLAAIFAVLAVQATRARDDARIAQARAELELTSERQTREFLLSVFHLADASEARGNSVTVREVLDRAVAKIDHTQFAHPEIRTRFLATMGHAYAELGLNKRGVEMLQHAVEDNGVEQSAEARAQRTDSRIELADLLYAMGEYDAALKQLDAAAAQNETLSWLQRAQLDDLRGDVFAYTEKDAQAKDSYHAALAAIEHAGIAPHDALLERAHSLSGLALLASFAGDYAQAKQGYQQVVGLLVPELSDLHPKTIEAVVSLGSCEFQMGDRDAARADWLRGLNAARKLFDPGSPVIATIENNLGRLLLETGDLAAAEPLLRDALASDRRNNSETFDDLAYPLYNLAFLRFVQGDRDEPAKLLDEALPIAEKAKHRMYGPILTTLADLHCERGNYKQGAAFAQRAIAINAEHADSAPWYADQAVLTQNYCLALAGTKVDRAALDKLIETLSKKWGATSPFTQRAREQITAIAKAQPS